MRCLNQDVQPVTSLEMVHQANDNIHFATVHITDMLQVHPEIEGQFPQVPQVKMFIQFICQCR